MLVVCFFVATFANLLPQSAAEAPFKCTPKFKAKAETFPDCDAYMARALKCVELSKVDNACASAKACDEQAKDNAIAAYNEACAIANEMQTAGVERCHETHNRCQLKGCVTTHGGRKGG